MKRIAFLIALVTLDFWLTFCGGGAIPARAQSGDTLAGVYIFHSQGNSTDGRAFSETGTITFAADGSYQQESVFNLAGSVAHMAVSGTYTLSGNKGQMKTQFDTSTLFATGDHNTLFTSSTDTTSTWCAELIKAQ